MCVKSLKKLVKCVNILIKCVNSNENSINIHQLSIKIHFLGSNLLPSPGTGGKRIMDLDQYLEKMITITEFI